MWQFPAVGGELAPTIYEGMDESYSHYLSEGYHLPWYAQSADMIRRPGKPMMGVFDNGYGSGDGDVYLKNAMQIRPAESRASARNIRGRSLKRRRRVRARRELYCRDVRPGVCAVPGRQRSGDSLFVSAGHHRDAQRARHAALGEGLLRHGAGLMCGVPMSIVYEEDVAAGWLTPKDGEKPRVPMLF